MSAWAPKPPCSVCRKLGCTDPTHRPEHLRRLRERQRPRRPYAETKRAKEFLAAWVAERGPLCVGWQRPPHYVSPSQLTSDHVVPYAQGGAGGPLQALCKPCNSARGNALRNKPAPPW